MFLGRGRKKIRLFGVGKNRIFEGVEIRLFGVENNRIFEASPHLNTIVWGAEKTIVFFEAGAVENTIV